MTNEHINIKYNTTDEVIKTKIILIKIPIIELHNEIIKPSPEGDFSGSKLKYGEGIFGCKF